MKSFKVGNGNVRARRSTSTVGTDSDGEGGIPQTSTQINDYMVEILKKKKPNRSMIHNIYKSWFQIGLLPENIS